MTTEAPRPQLQYHVGGDVDASRSFYIPRKADAQLLAYCLAGEYAYIFNARQTGKSSLILRTQTALRERGIASVKVTIEDIGTQAGDDPWYFSLLTAITEALPVATSLSAWWQAHEALTPTLRWRLFFEEVLVREVEAPVVVFLDEIDRLREVAFRGDVGGALRRLRKRRGAGAALERLTFGVAGAATPHELLGDDSSTA